MFGYLVDAVFSSFRTSRNATLSRSADHTSRSKQDDDGPELQYKRYFPSTGNLNADPEDGQNDASSDEDDGESEPVVPMNPDAWSAADLRKSLASNNSSQRCSKFELLYRDNQMRERLANRANIVPGVRNIAGNKHERRIKLPFARVPEKIFQILEDDDLNFEDFYPHLLEPLTRENYSRKFATLLHMEEAASKMQMRQYDMNQVIFKRSGKFLSLHVPGIVDNRPSLMVGDIAMVSTAASGRIFEGVIHFILGKSEEILLHFNQEFQDKYDGSAYNVGFMPSRTYFQRCHFAIENAPKQTEVLFPNGRGKTSTSSFTRSENQIIFVNKNLNSRQKRAVLGVLKYESRPSPYIIFGPPGTGKTVTLVETILQVLKNFPRANILACAPSNSCVDLIALKLIASGQVSPRNLVRLMAFHRMDLAPPELEDYVMEAGVNTSIDYIKRQIIITTLGSVGHVMSLTKFAHHFTHCFLDEAAQATEPEAMQLIYLMSQTNGITVLTGDPYQLGPINNCKVANPLGLGKPLITRLFELAPYRRYNDKFHEHGNYNPVYITKLVESYRCCLDLIYVNSKMFYHAELQCHPERDTELLGKLGLSHPIVFEGVEGENVRENDSHSWCNFAEIVQCTRYLKMLQDAGVKPDDIGIITPYRKQMEKFRDFFRQCDLESCKIATVEEFQGNEKKVIIVSLVRTDPVLVPDDMKKQFGFVFNDKRFNVATSRAKSLLIVVGDPFCFARDECWRLFIANCMLRGSYTGRPFTAKDMDRIRYGDDDSDQESTEEPANVDEIVDHWND